MVFQCINICQVPWEVLKTAAFGLGFQHLPRDLANVNAWKTKFDPYIQMKCKVLLYYLACCLVKRFPRHEICVWIINWLKEHYQIGWVYDPMMMCCMKKLGLVMEDFQSYAPLYSLNQLLEHYQIWWIYRSLHDNI